MCRSLRGQLLLCLQTGRMHNDGVLRTLRHIQQTEGIRGFFKCALHERASLFAPCHLKPKHGPSCKGLPSLQALMHGPSHAEPKCNLLMP